VCIINVKGEREGGREGAAVGHLLLQQKLKMCVCTINIIGGKEEGEGGQRWLQLPYSSERRVYINNEEGWAVARSGGGRTKAAPRATPTT